MRKESNGHYSLNSLDSINWIAFIQQIPLDGRHTCQQSLNPKCRLFAVVNMLMVLVVNHNLYDHIVIAYRRCSAKRKVLGKEDNEIWPRYYLEDKDN